MADETVLDLRNWKLGGDHGAIQLAETLKTNTSWTTLDLSGNSIGDVGAAVLAKALEVNSTVTTLYLYNNSIGDVGAAALAKALETNNTVTTLNLWDNHIDGDGATALAKALEKNSTVTTLNLYNNSIGGDGATALAKALETNNTVTTLNLSNNSIGGDGATALAKALETNSTVAYLYLDLGYNQIGDVGATALAKALETNSTVTTLYLDSNSIGDAGATALAKGLKMNSTLIYLSLARNDTIGVGGSEAFLETLQLYNRTLLQLDTWKTCSTSGEIQSLLQTRYDVAKIYNQALQKGRERPVRIRLIMSGPSGAGKTSIVRSLRGEEFIKTHLSTEGIKVDTHPLGRDRTFQQGLDDYHKHASLQRQRQYTPPYSFLLDTRHQIRKLTRPNSVGESIDAPDDSSVYHPSDPPLDPLDALHFPSSNAVSSDDSVQGRLDYRYADPSTGVDGTNEDSTFKIIWDLGGQDQYLYMHQLFFRRNCLYLLVLNLVEPDFEKMLLAAKEWIMAIVSSTGPDIALVVVGTRAGDSQFASLDEAHTRLEELKDLLVEKLPLNDDIEDLMHNACTVVVENTTGAGVDCLHDELRSIAESLLNNANEFPLSWLRFMEKLKGTELPKGDLCLPMKEVRKIAESVGVREEEDIVSALQFMDTYGDIIFINEDGLRDWVFTRPEDMLKVKKSLVVDQPLGIRNRHALQSIRARGFVDWKTLSSIWNSNGFQQHGPLIRLLVEAGLVIEMKTGIIVTSRLPQHVDIQQALLPLENECEITVTTECATHLPINMYSYVLSQLHHKFGLKDIRDRFDVLSQSTSCICLEGKRQVDAGMVVGNKPFRPSDGLDFRLFLRKNLDRNSIDMSIRCSSSGAGDVVNNELVSKSIEVTKFLHHVLLSRYPELEKARWCFLRSSKDRGQQFADRGSCGYRSYHLKDSIVTNSALFAAASDRWMNARLFEEPPGQTSIQFQFFISHRGEDSKFVLALPLQYILGKFGIHSFVDKESIRHGERVEKEIAAGLYGCSHGVVLISDNFLDSEWCRRELRTLHKRRQEDDCFKIFSFFHSETLLHQSDFKPLRQDGAKVRESGIGDRPYLIKFLVPALLSISESKYPSAFAQRNNYRLIEQYLDEYLYESEPKVTIPASLRRDF